MTLKQLQFKPAYDSDEDDLLFDFITTGKKFLTLIALMTRLKEVNGCG
jgi:hypothetical protein